jgi:hypothetical protein
LPNSIFVFVADSSSGPARASSRHDREAGGHCGFTLERLLWAAIIGISRAELSPRPELKMKRILGFLILFIIASGTLRTIQAKPQKKPGRPAGTPGLTYVVLDFQVSTLGTKNRPDSGREGAFLGRMLPLSMRIPNLGRKIADAFVPELKESGAAKVVRKNVVFSEADLKNANRTNSLRQELGADVVVGGTVVESGEYLTATSVRAQDAVVLGVSREKVEDPRALRQSFMVSRGTNKKTALGFVMEMEGSAYVRAAGSAEEVPLRNLEPLYPGDQVRSNDGGDLVIQINGRVFRIKPSDGWFTVRGPAEIALRGLAKTIFEMSEEKYAVVGGRAR